MDIDFGEQKLFRASDARLLIENLLPARRRGRTRSRLDQRELEAYLVFRLVYDLTTKSPTGEFERL
jgi:hypothetical protein